MRFAPAVGRSESPIGRFDSRKPAEDLRPSVLVRQAICLKPHGHGIGAPPQVVDMPVQLRCAAEVTRYTRLEATRAESTAYVKVETRGNVNPTRVTHARRPAIMTPENQNIGS